MDSIFPYLTIGPSRPTETTRSLEPFGPPKLHHPFLRVMLGTQLHSSLFRIFINVLIKKKLIVKKHEFQTSLLDQVNSLNLIDFFLHLQEQNDFQSLAC